jgi:hypothetical protein
MTGANTSSHPGRRTSSQEETMYESLLVMSAISGVLSMIALETPERPFETAYFGQRFPGRTPEPFASDVIPGNGQRLHGPIVFSPDCTEVCWAVIPPAIMSMRCRNGVWSNPQPLDLRGRVVQAPAYSPDGARLYYQAVGEDGTGGVEIWVVDRNEQGWGLPRSVGSEVNHDRLQSQPCLARNGTLYYTGYLEGVAFERGIFRSRFMDGRYAAPELLGNGINSEHIDYCPWIAPDESYLLFASSRPRNEEPLYIHVSFRLDDGSWSDPQSIHQAIGFSEAAGFPSVSPDGRILFFISGNTAYWVDMAPVLELNTY